MTGVPRDTFAPHPPGEAPRPARPASAATEERRQWRARGRSPVSLAIKLLQIAAVLGVVVAVCAVPGETWTALVEAHNRPRALADDWADAHVPNALRSFVTGATALLASPLLYAMLIGVFVAEHYLPAAPGQARFSRGFVQDFCAWFLLDAPLKAAATALSLAAMYFMLDRWMPAWRLSDASAAQLPVALRVALAIVVGDFMKWCHHVLMHKVRPLWFFHSVHHSQKELNLFTELRFHAVETMLLAPLYYVPLYLCNLDFEAALTAALLVDWYPRINHANLRTNFGLLRYVLVTPQSHRVHHSLELRHRDRNFGVLFCCWDRLFGTQWPHDDEYPATGIADEEFPWEESVAGLAPLANYFAQLTYPFSKLLSRDGDRSAAKQE